MTIESDLSGFRLETKTALIDALDGIVQVGLLDFLSHVLAALMEIPHVLLDNSHGKMSSIYNDYTHKVPSARFATSQTEALELATDLLAKGNA